MSLMRKADRCGHIFHREVGGKQKALSLSNPLMGESLTVLLNRPIDRLVAQSTYEGSSKCFHRWVFEGARYVARRHPLAE